MTEFSPRPETRSPFEVARERFPAPEDWIALQGGKPRVFRKINSPRSPWVVLHVYDEHGTPKKRFQSGIIVDTLADRTTDMSRFRIDRMAEDENEQQIRVVHDIEVPSFMVRALHGEVCNNRTGSAGSVDGYDRITNQPAYESFIEKMQYRNMQELRFGLDATSGFAMIPLPGIRPPRPLGE